LYPFLHFKVSLSSSVLRLELNGGLNYPGADYIVRRITYLLDKANKSGVTVKSLVLDGSHMPEMDFAVVQALDELIQSLFVGQSISVSIIVQPQVMPMFEHVKSRKMLTLVPTELPTLTTDSPTVLSDASINVSPHVSLFRMMYCEIWCTVYADSDTVYQVT
jgi:MFS superfamily sulfate permease-like transporter